MTLTRAQLIQFFAMQRHYAQGLGLCTSASLHQSVSSACLQKWFGYCSAANLLARSSTPEAQLDGLQQVLTSWTERLKNYQNLIEEKFLQQAVALAAAA